MWIQLNTAEIFWWTRVHAPPQTAHSLARNPSVLSVSRDRDHTSFLIIADFWRTEWSTGLILWRSEYPILNTWTEQENNICRLYACRACSVYSHCYNSIVNSITCRLFVYVNTKIYLVLKVISLASRLIILCSSPSKICREGVLYVSYF